MQIRKLITYSFSPNVGTKDRIFRIISGLMLASLPAFVAMPLWALIPVVAFGVVWLMTGLVSRCGVYYLVGHSSCPALKEAR